MSDLLSLPEDSSNFLIEDQHGIVVEVVIAF